MKFRTAFLWALAAHFLWFGLALGNTEEFQCPSLINGSSTPEPIIIQYIGENREVSTLLIKGPDPRNESNEFVFMERIMTKFFPTIFHYNAKAGVGIIISPHGLSHQKLSEEVVAYSTRNQLDLRILGGTRYHFRPNGTLYRHVNSTVLSYLDGIKTQSQLFNVQIPTPY